MPDNISPLDKFINEQKLSNDFQEKLFDALFESNWIEADEAENLKEENNRLNSLINTPETINFIEGVQNEAAHQNWRFGDEHDLKKSAGDWFWTLGYLGQKAMFAAEKGDIDKAKHHTISSAALLANWHKQLSRK